MGMGMRMGMGMGGEMEIEQKRNASCKHTVRPAAEEPLPEV
jgi:hypothetical protein